VGCVPSAIELSKKVAARCGDVAVIWAGDALLAGRCLSALEGTCEDAHGKHEKKEKGSHGEHVECFVCGVLKSLS
jgi:hypothetical protein